MRIIRIVNIVALLAFIFLWILLYFTRETYMGSGLTYPAQIDSTAIHFSNQNPYSFVYNNNIYGFKSTSTSQGDTIITGIWELNTDSNLVNYYSIPDANIDKIEALNMNPDSQLVIVGSRHDSLISVIFFDSIIEQNIQFSAPSEFLGMGFHKGRTELVFGRSGKVLGHIYTISDTAKMRTYDLPNFYNRICEIIQVFVEDDTWKFLTQTDFYRRNDVWIILDTSRKSNYLIWDERAVYPEYPGVQNIHSDVVLDIMDYSLSKKIPLLPQRDSVLQFQNRKLKLIKPVKQKNRFFATANILPDTTTWLITSYDTSNNKSGFLSSGGYLGNINSNIPWEMSDSAYHFLIPESKSKQIFFGLNEYPTALFELKDGHYILMSSKLNYAILDQNGISLKRTNYFKMLHSTIIRIYPEKRKILEVDFPEFGAIRYFFMLYGLIPLWLLSLIINWLILVLKKKPKFSVRDNHLPFSLRLLPGSIIFLLFFGISIMKMLHDFAIL